MKFICVWLWIFPAFITISSGYKILGIFHTTHKSHFNVGSALMRELADRGHQITTISPFRLDTPVENYTEVIIDGVIDPTINTTGSLMGLQEGNYFNRFRKFYKFEGAMTQAAFQHAEFKKFLNSRRKFDLIVIDMSLNEAFLGLSLHFNAPVVGLSTAGNTMWMKDLVGTPAPLSYIPYPFYQLTENMNFYERLKNVIVTTVGYLYHEFIFMPSQVKLYNEYFPDPKPDLFDLRRNVSLVLLANHFTLNHPQPSVPNAIEVGGMHMNREIKPLPNDLAEFMDSATDGVIYFSLGSNIKFLETDKLTEIVNIFSTRKERVLWKSDRTNIPGLTENIRVKSWLPKNDILAHQNLKLVITYGCLLSISDAVYHGIPLLGIPAFPSQIQNIAFAEQAGYAVRLDLNELSGDKLREALNEILSNPRYAEKAKIVSRRFRDQPLTPLDTAVYWTEYVMRHKGAPHMRSRAQDLNFIQYHSIDTFSLLFVAILILGYILIKLFKKLTVFITIFWINFDIKEKRN